MVRPEKHIFLNKVGYLVPKTSEELRLSRVVLRISGVNLTSLNSTRLLEEISGFSPSSTVKTEEG